MPDLTAKRTLVKSPPELWEELSEVEGLAKHLGAFGEIKITKLEPEHTVAWEGEHASGTVSIEASGWGTKVTLHAELADAEEPASEPEATDPEEPGATEPELAEPEPAQPEAVLAEEPEPKPADAESERGPIATEPVLVEAVSLPEPDPQPKRRGFWAWLFRSRTEAASSEPMPSAPEPQSLATDPEPVVTEPEPEPSGAEDVPELEVDTQADVEAGVSEPAAPQPEPVEAEGEPDSLPLDPERARLVLDEALEALGSAHHRPFSRG